MPAAPSAYLEIIDFIASGTTPEAVIEFQSSVESQARLQVLLEREREEAISAEEKAELDHFLELEHILRMAKAKARLILSRSH